MGITKLVNFSSNTIAVPEISAGANANKGQNDFSFYVNANWKNQTSQTVDDKTDQSTSSSAKEDSVSNAYGQYQYKDKSITSAGLGNQNISDETASKVTQVLEDYKSSVKSLLKDKLGVTDEEIEQAMTTLGFTAQDLLVPQNMASLVSTLTGNTDTVNLLMSDSFQEIMNSVSSLATNLLDDLGVNMDQLKEICASMKASSNSTPQADVQEQNQATDSTVEQATTNAAAEQVSQDTSQKVVSDTQVVQTEQVETTTKAVTDTSAETKQSKSLTQADDVEPTSDKQETITPAKVTTNESDSGDKSKSQSEASPNEKNTLTAQPKELDGEEEPTVAKTDVEKEIAGHDKTKNTSVSSIYMNNVNQNVTQDVSSQVPQMQQSYIDVQDVIDQISEYTKILKTEDTTTMQMQLNPENLGKIYIEVSHKAGAIAATITATNEAVKEALQSQIANLKESLNQQGIKVDAVEVAIASHEYERNLDQNNSNQQGYQSQSNSFSDSGENAKKDQSEGSYTRTINVNYLDSDEMDDDEKLVLQLMKDNGNQMDVTV